jgi:RHS repeat-associated protein
VAPEAVSTNKCDETANPVNATSGMKVQRITDFSTEGQSPLAFMRAYYSEVGAWNGNTISKSRLGRGWHSNFDAALEFTGNGQPQDARATLPDGRELRFTQTTGVIYIPVAYNPVTNSWTTTNPAVKETLVLLSDNVTWRLTLTDGTVYVFTQSGPDSQLNSIQYLGGYTQTLTWSGGKNTQVTDNLGRSISFTYGNNGKLSVLTEPDGRQIKYSYISRNEDNFAAYAQTKGLSTTDVLSTEYALKTVLYPDSTPGTDADNPKVQYHYEYSNFPFALTGITDERGIRYATWSYDTSGRVLTSEHAGGVEDYMFSYDTVNNRTTVTNALGKQARYHYTRAVPGPRRLTTVEGLVSTHCAASDTTFTYDTAGFLEDTTDGEGRVTRHVNNARGLVTSITRGYGTASAATISYTWHSTLRMPTQMVQPGLTTDVTWNSSNQLTQITQTDTTSHSVPYSTNGQTRTWVYTYTTTGGLLASVDGPLSGTGDTSSYTYNSNGFIQTVTNEIGHVTTFTAWNGRGQPTSMTDANSVVSSLSYDERGRLKTVTADPGGIAALTGLEYNGPGDVTKITRPNGAYLQYTWDNARRLIKIEDNTGASVEYDRDDMGDITAQRVKNAGGTTLLSQTATYDELGRLLTFVGAASQTWTGAYDKADNPVSVTDPRSNVYQWAFDSLNRLIRETDEQGGQVNLTLNSKDEVTAYSDPRSLSTPYVRNGFGDVIQRASPDSGTTVYVVDALGKPTQITDGRGVVTNLTYDNAGRTLTREYPAATGENITYTWDSVAGGNKGKGRITRIDDASGSIEKVYDALGRTTQEIKTTGSAVYTVSYAYDADGNITQATYPSGRIVTYSRDSLGRISGVTTKKDSGSATVTLASSVTYQPFGPLASLSYGNGLTLAKTFTSDYLLNALRVMDGTTAIIDRTHAFSDGINLTGFTESAVSGRNEGYAYTAANRLQNATGPWDTLAYSYDLVGNRTSEALTQGSTTTTWSYAYPSGSNRLSTVTQGANVRTLTHDGAGNISADARLGTTYNYRYNKRGRLDQLSVGSTVTADYIYDGLERLALRTTQNMTPAGTTHYVYDLAGHLIAEASDTGATLREYVWLDELPLAVVADVDTMSPNLYFVHADHLDRPVKMTNGGKAVVWDAVYRPFGEAHSISGSAANNLRFPGQYFLIESGLHYNWHRHYDPSLGRYTQPDPLEFVDGPAMYSYARSRPTMEIDPDGRNPVVPVIVGTAWICSRYPHVCAATAAAVVNACLQTYRVITGSGDGGNDDCENLYYNIDTPTCNAVTKNRGKVAGTRCHASAAQRYSACLRGDPLPPLNVWNN